MVISCLVNIVQGGGGEVLPRFGMLETSPKTVKCVITFETDCSPRFASLVHSRVSQTLIPLRINIISPLQMLAVSTKSVKQTKNRFPIYSDLN